MVKLQKSEKGFSIIEVLIVLAIAGLIMVVVFLAVPALQRNARNNALSTNVNNVYSGLSNFVSNNNGLAPDTIDDSSIDSTGELLIQNNTVSGSNDETVKVDSSITAVTISASKSIDNTSDVGTLEVIKGKNGVCNTTKTDLVGGASGSNRSMAILYVAEGSSAGTKVLRCVD